MLLNISFLSLALIGLSLSILYKLFQAFTDPLRHIPGPFLARFSRLWYLLEVYRGTFELTNIKLHKKHGPVVRIAPNEYSIDDVDAAKTIYGHGNAFVKAQWYAPWSPPDPSKASLFSDLDPHHHASQRRKFAAAYSMSSLVGYECFVDECSALITQRFREIAKLGQTIDMAHWLQCYAFEVIGHITFANRFGLLDMGIDEEGIFSAIDGRTYYGTFVGIYPWIHNKYIYPILLKFGSLGPGYLLKYTLKQIEARQASLKDPRRNGAYEGPTDIMTKILISHETNPEKVSKTDIITMCQSNIGAGSDTTAISLSSIFYHLLKNPQMMQRLRSEIDTAAKEGRISDPITFKESQDHLPYLQAVIKEGLRMHPATGLGLERVVPATGATISGVDFPPGATVGINAWVAHRNTSVFGADASSFRPERWLESPTPNSNDNDNSKQQFEAMDRYFLAFGLGSRTCIGKNISLLEMCKLVPQVVRKFDFGLDEGLQGREWKTLNRWFVKQMDFRVRVFERRMGVQEKM